MDNEQQAIPEDNLTSDVSQSHSHSDETQPKSKAKTKLGEFLFETLDTKGKNSLEKKQLSIINNLRSSLSYEYTQIYKNNIPKLYDQIKNYNKAITKAVNAYATELYYNLLLTDDYISKANENFHKTLLDSYNKIKTTITTEKAYINDEQLTIAIEDIKFKSDDNNVVLNIPGERIKYIADTRGIWRSVNVEKNNSVNEPIKQPNIQTLAFTNVKDRWSEAPGLYEKRTAELAAELAAKRTAKQKKEKNTTENIGGTRRFKNKNRKTSRKR